MQRPLLSYATSQSRLHSVLFSVAPSLGSIHDRTCLEDLGESYLPQREVIDRSCLGFRSSHYCSVRLTCIAPASMSSEGRFCFYEGSGSPLSSEESEWCLPRDLLQDVFGSSCLRLSTVWVSRGAVIELAGDEEGAIDIYMWRGRHDK